jgi:hypothetical protein
MLPGNARDMLSSTVILFRLRSFAFVMGLLTAVVLSAVSPGAAATTPSEEAHRVLTHVSDFVISGRAKPITRSVLAPKRQSPDLRFSAQSDLTSDLVDRYLCRAISHFLPWSNPLRSRDFLQDTGTKYIHWSHLLWGQPPPDWKTLCAETDAVHGSDWGSDVVYEAGVMEAIYRSQIDGAAIPDWLFQCMEDLGINKTRKPGPNGPHFFSYENMFDRGAERWPKDNIGRWSRDKDGKDQGSVPDLTMVETQLWFAYLITEYIDAGFEGIFFGQYDLVGSRDTGSECLWELTQFTKRLAAERGYRHAVFLSTHHYCVAYKGQLSPDSPTIFTHMTWPSRMFYSSKHEFGMETGLNATVDGQHRTAAELNMVIKKPPFDLPVLIEIDNYGPSAPGSPLACNSEGDDEITAYKKKPHSARVGFLKYYCREFQTYTNKRGKSGRVHLAPSGERMGYMPYREQDGEEETIKELFTQAASAPIIAPALLAGPPAVNAAPVASKEYRDSKRGFSLSYPESAGITDKSAQMKPKGPGSFWVEFSVKRGGKISYVVNVRHITLDVETAPDNYAVANPYLSSWDRISIDGIGGFRTATDDTAPGKIPCRALLVDGSSIWMLNLTNVSPGDLETRKKVFELMLRSLDVRR